MGVLLKLQRGRGWWTLLQRHGVTGIGKHSRVLASRKTSATVKYMCMNGFPTSQICNVKGRLRYHRFVLRMR